MKKILALTISSLVVTGAYAEPTRTKTTEQRQVIIDDNNRRAILAALGTSDEEARAVAVLSPPPVVEQPKAKIKNETISKEKVVTTVVPTSTEKKPIKELETVVKVPVVPKVEPKVVATVEKKSETIVKAPVAPKVDPIAVIKKDLPIAKPVNTPIPSNSVQSKNELTPILAVTKPEVACSCETKKIVKPVKKVSYKKVTKKFVKKTQKIKATNELDFVKSPYSVSEVPYGTKVISYITNQDVSSNLIYAKDTKSLTLSIANINGQALNSEDFISVEPNTQVSAYLMNTDLSHMEKQRIQLLSNQKEYDLQLSNNSCKALFVQYQLKGSNEQYSLVKYFDKQGNMSLNIDNQCPTVKANTQDNVTYSNENYTTGIFINNASLHETKPLTYNIIVNRNGQSFIPGNLKSFIVSKDLSQFYESKSLSKGRIGISGETYSQKLGRGVYYVVAQFAGEKAEQGINVEVNIN